MRRFAWFDCLRCIAVLMVILTHVPDASNRWPRLLAWIYETAHQIGWIGVDLFFVLSGFLVSGLLFEEHDRTGTLRIGRFLIRRGFKIIPAFYVLIAVTVAYDLIVRHTVNLTHVTHDLFFLQSYRLSTWGHEWTLAVEVHFYLLLALLLWWLARKGAGKNWLTRLPAILIGVLGASLAARLLNSGLRSGDFNIHRELQPSHLHLDVLAAGVLLRYLYNYRTEALAVFRRARWAWVGLGLLLIWPSEYLWTPHPFWVTALIPTLNWMGFGLIVFEATQFHFPETGFVRWLAWPFDYFGRHSYSIYLWHLAVKTWIADRYCTSDLSYFLTCFGGSLAVGTLFSLALEVPVLKLRNRLFPSVTPEARPAPLASVAEVPAQTPS